jgi:hypothetical protein
MKIVGFLCGREYSFPPTFIARVNQLGAKGGVAAEFVKLAGTKMGEAARYKVIVDRISHEVEYYRGYLKHAALEGTYVINNPFWWTADDKFFNYAMAAKLGIAIRRRCCCRKGYPQSGHQSCATLDIRLIGMMLVGRPAILKPFSGGGWNARFTGA